MKLTRGAFQSFDGVEIAYAEVGTGRPTLLLHGFMASADLAWVRTGIAAALLSGRRLILPDLRGHGRSAAPQDQAAYPPDVAAMDQEALIAKLRLRDYDLVGYSFGARTALRLIARGARPRRCVVGGLGDIGMTDPAPHMRRVEDALCNGEQAADPRAGRLLQAKLSQRGLDRRAMLGMVGSSLPATREELAMMTLPILVVSGVRDRESGSVEQLAALLPLGEALTTPGDHHTAIVSAEFAEAIRRFLDGGQPVERRPSVADPGRADPDIQQHGPHGVSDANGQRFTAPSQRLLSA